MAKNKSDFTYHKVSEAEKTKIQKQAKKLLQGFAAKLEKIKTKTTDEHFHSSTDKQGLREEGSGWNTDPEFKDLMFLNAPFVDDDFIVAEKGGWK